MFRAPRPLAAVGGALAAGIVAASIAFVVVSPSFAAEAERPVPGDRVPNELMWVAIHSCLQYSGAASMQLDAFDDADVLRAHAADDRGRVDPVATDRANACFADYRFEEGVRIGFGWQPTPGEALAMHDLAIGRVVPCLIAQGLPPRPRGAMDFANGDWSVYPELTTPERLPDVVAAYRACGSPAAPFRPSAPE